MQARIIQIPVMQTCILLLEGGSWASLISDLSIGHQSVQGVLSHTSRIVNAKWISIFPPTWISLPTIHSSSFPHLYAMDLSLSPSGSESSYLSLFLPPSAFSILPLWSVKHSSAVAQAPITPCLPGSPSPAYNTTPTHSTHAFQTLQWICCLPKCIPALSWAFKAYSLPAPWDSPVRR